jgi:DNA-binding protein H-NS
MAQSLAQIRKQIDTLKRQAEQIRKAEVADVIARIKEAIRFYELTAKDLGLAGVSSSSAKPAKARRVAGKRGVGRAKYADPATGRTWTGHGRKPQWFIDAVASGKSPQELAVSK